MRFALNMLCWKMPIFGTLWSVGKGSVCARPSKVAWTLIGWVWIYSVPRKHSIDIHTAPHTLKIWNHTKQLGVVLNLCRTVYIHMLTTKYLCSIVVCVCVEFIYRCLPKFNLGYVNTNTYGRVGNFCFSPYLSTYIYTYLFIHLVIDVCIHTLYSPGHTDS